jgi:hypothetical protein
MDRPQPTTTRLLTCSCCGTKYARGQWNCCAPPTTVKPEAWMAQWHEGCPTAIVDGPGTRVCPRHCRCERVDADGQLPLPRARVTLDEIKALAQELRTTTEQRKGWLPYRDE